jgi:hypothetical protein
MHREDCIFIEAGAFLAQTKLEVDIRICAKGFWIFSRRKPSPGELLVTYALDDPAQKREGYKINQSQCSD